MSEMRALTLEELFLIEGGDDSCGFWCWVGRLAEVATIAMLAIMIVMVA
jgi:hypothetical protein